MHDPKVVAWDLVLPIPKRGWRHNDARLPGDYRWGVRRRRRTNPENLGEPVYPLYRASAWKPLRIAGRSWRWWPLGTIWHNEPRGRDALTVCGRDAEGRRKSGRGWAWHVHHWSFQWFFGQKLRRSLFERCKECGRGFPWGYAPVSHQWDGPRSRWFRIHRQSYHHECSSLVSFRRATSELEDLLRVLVGILTIAGNDEADTLEWLTNHNSPITEFHQRYRLQGIFGYERDDQYRLVKKVRS